MQDLPEDGSNLAIVKTIIGLGQELGLAVIAKGVESLQQRDTLFRADCSFFQGNFFSKPAPFVTGPDKGAIKNDTAVVFVKFVIIRK